MIKAKLKIRLLLKILILFSVNFVYAESTKSVEIITLNYHQAEELIPVVKSMVGSTDSVTGFKNQLIVTTTPEKLKTVKDIIQQLDKVPQRLLITVGNKTEIQKTDKAVSVDGAINIGDGKISTGRKSKDSVATVTIIDKTKQKNDNSLQQLQAVEGFPAYIQVGQRVPLTTRSVDVYGNYVETISYEDVTQGFYVVVRIVKDEVIIEASTNNNELVPRRVDSIKVQETASAVRGKLGQWIELGQINLTSNEQTNKLLSTQKTNKMHTSDIMIKVEKVQ